MTKDYTMVVASAVTILGAMYAVGYWTRDIKAERELPTAREIVKNYVADRDRLENKLKEIEQVIEENRALSHQVNQLLERNSKLEDELLHYRQQEAQEVLHRLEQLTVEIRGEAYERSRNARLHRWSFDQYIAACMEDGSLCT